MIRSALVTSNTSNRGTRPSPAAADRPDAAGRPVSRTRSTAPAASPGSPAWRTPTPGGAGRTSIALPYPSPPNKKETRVEPTEADRLLGMAQALVSGLLGLWTLAQALFFLFRGFGQGSLNGPTMFKAISDNMGIKSIFSCPIR